MLFDDGKLAGQGVVDDARSQSVEAGKQFFRKTEMAFAGIFLKCLHDLSGHVLRAVAPVAEFLVQGVDGG